MNTVFRERAGCSWHSEAIGIVRDEFQADAAYHARHGDDLTKCDAWLCVCGRTDSRGGSWETCDETGAPMEPTNDWPGSIRCTECGRVYSRDGFVARSV